VADAGLTQNTRVHQLHVYGAPNPAANPDRILLINSETGLEFDNVYDFGPTPRGGVRTIEMGVKNNSATMTANTVTLGLHSYFDNIYELKDGAGAYSSQLSLGNITPGSTYTNTITLKVDTSGSSLGTAANRVTINTSSWS
jgi:hypothetical protein